MEENFELEEKVEEKLERTLKWRRKWKRLIGLLLFGKSVCNWSDSS